MQTGLVVVTVKVRETQSQHSFIVPPDEKEGSALKEIGETDVGPEPLSKDVLRSELHQGGHVRPLAVQFVTPDDVDWDEHGAANNCK